MTRVLILVNLTQLHASCSENQIYLKRNFPNCRDRKQGQVCQYELCVVRPLSESFQVSRAPLSLFSLTITQKIGYLVTASRESKLRMKSAVRCHLTLYMQDTAAVS